eukprot:757286-Hanusia_phi.AAC.2
MSDQCDRLLVCSYVQRHARPPGSPRPELPDASGLTPAAVTIRAGAHAAASALAAGGRALSGSTVTASSRATRARPAAAVGRRASGGGAAAAAEKGRAR